MEATEKNIFDPLFYLVLDRVLWAKPKPSRENNCLKIW